MPAVLVHGVPETPAVWDLVRQHLHRDDVIALQLPGFGCPRPAGFGATKEEYVAWLVGELERIAAQGPIDLVRSWVCDCAAIGDVDFEWHDFAKIWQTPGEGEKFYEDSLAQPAEERGAMYAALFGVPVDAATELNRAIDQTMVDCILALYRSAADVGKEWSPDFHDIAAPGRIVIPSDDAFISADLGRNSARRTGATTAELDGLGHWWMLQDPARAAAVLEEFWATVG